VEKKFDIDLYKEENKSKVMEDIEADTFKQSSFKAQSKKIVVDLNKDKILVPTTSDSTQFDDNLIHPSFLGNDDEKRIDKFIKRLHILRNQ
jgi:hypothetical protein